MDEHNIVVNYIRDDLEKRFNVLVNVGGTQRWFIGEMIPDLIVKEKGGDRVLFVIEVKSGQNFATEINQLKNYGNFPGILYLIVPQDKVAEAKYLATVSGIKARFGYYQVQDGKVKEVKYDV